jgi:sugar lactone lactonase YvrE
MQLERRDFLRVGGGGLAALLASPRWASADSPAESPAAPKAVLTWGTSGHGDGQFDVPIAVAVNQKDEILVTDFRQVKGDPKSRVQRFDGEGRFLGAFEVDSMPGGLAIDKDGLLYVSHMMLHKIVVHDPAGKVVREFGKQGAAPGEFDQPGGIAFGKDGSLFVADQVNQRVQRVSPQGEPIGCWGKHGVATGEFGGKASKHGRGGGPHFVAFNSQGDVYTTEASEGRVQKFTADGKFLLSWGDNEVGPGHFGGHAYMPGPLAVAVDHQDHVWLTSTNNYLHEFTADGSFLRRIGGEGTEPGQFHLPHGLAFDSQHFLYVADARNSRIQKLAI